MKNNIKELEKQFTKNLQQFAPGTGFGDPEARKNAELQTLFSFLKLQAEQNKKFKRTANIIDFVVLPLIVIQTLFTVLTYYFK